MEVSPRAVLRDTYLTDRSLETRGLLYRDRQRLQSVGTKDMTAIAVGLLDIVLLSLDPHEPFTYMIELGEVAHGWSVGRREEEREGGLHVLGLRGQRGRLPRWLRLG